MNYESHYNNYIEFNGRKTIYNALYKSSITVEDVDTIKKLIDANDEEAISTLKGIGMIVSEHPTEAEILRYLFNKSYFGGNRFLNIVLVPSLDCNFKCPYCFEKVDGNDNLFNTNLEHYFQTIKQFANFNFPAYDNVEISLFGGEPLLFADRIFDFFGYIDSTVPNTPYISSIVTNGALLDEKTTEKLIRFHCRSIQITIDGNKKIHDENRIFKNGRVSYDLLIENISKIISLLPNECQFNLRINLNNVSASQVESTLLDIDPNLRSKIKILFRPIYNTDSFKQNNENKFSELKSFLDMAIKMGFDIVRNTYYYQACESCSGENFFFIMPDLSIWKCINDINFTDARVGEIGDDGKIRFDADKLVKWYGYSNCFHSAECKQCKMLPDCFGGCVLYHAKNGHHSCKEFDMAVLPYLY